MGYEAPLFGKYSYVPTFQKNLLPLSETRRCTKAFLQKVGTWFLNHTVSRPRKRGLGTDHHENLATVYIYMYIYIYIYIYTNCNTCP